MASRRTAEEFSRSTGDLVNHAMTDAAGDHFDAISALMAAAAMLASENEADMADAVATFTVYHKAFCQHRERRNGSNVIKLKGAV